MCRGQTVHSPRCGRERETREKGSGVGEPKRKRRMHPLRKEERQGERNRGKLVEKRVKGGEAKPKIIREVASFSAP